MQNSGNLFLWMGMNMDITTYKLSYIVIPNKTFNYGDCINGTSKDESSHPLQFLNNLFEARCDEENVTSIAMTKKVC